MSDTSTNPVAPLTSTDVAARLHAERERLLAEQNLEEELAGQRLAPLEAGDDMALDRIEAQLNSCRDRQFRIQERIELLERRAEDVRRSEQEGRLDALTRHAECAREMGEELIRKDYARLAASLADVLMRLSATERVIKEANEILHEHGRGCVRAANLIRSRPRTESTRTVRRKVGLMEREHPYCGKATRSGDDRAIVNATGETVPAFMEVEIQEQCVSEARRPAPLPESVVLPPYRADDVGAAAPYLWDGTAYKGPPSVPPELMEALRAEIAALVDRSASNGGGMLARAAKGAAKSFGLRAKENAR